MHSSVYRWVAWVGLWVLIVANAARGESVLNFQSSPISAGVPEFVYTGGAAGQLLAGPGSLGNGDGALPPNLQTAGGLFVSTPFVIPDAIVGKSFSGSTTNFYDVTMSLTGFQAAGRWPPCPGSPASAGSARRDGYPGFVQSSGVRAVEITSDASRRDDSHSHSGARRRAVPGAR